MKSETINMSNIPMRIRRDTLKATLVSQTKINMKTILMISKMILLDTQEMAFTRTVSATECLDPITTSRIKGCHQGRNPQAVLVLSLVLEVAFSRDPLSKANNSNNLKGRKVNSKPESLLIETITKTTRKRLRLVPRDSFHLLIRDHLAPTISWIRTARSFRTQKIKLTVKCLISAQD